MKHAMLTILAVGVIALIIGTFRDDNFWSTAAQRGDRLMARKHYVDAAKAYDDPLNQGIAFYRNGDFKEAAAAFARVADPAGEYDRGNALLMHGAYDDAIAAYDQALGFMPGLQLAIDNRAIAVARKAAIENAPDDGTGGQEKPDKIVVDDKAKPGRSHDVQMNEGKPMSDEDMQAAWLRRVQTKPADFLEAKFAYQLQDQGK